MKISNVAEHINRRNFTQQSARCCHTISGLPPAMHTRPFVEVCGSFACGLRSARVWRHEHCPPKRRSIARRSLIG